MHGGGKLARGSRFSRRLLGVLILAVLGGMLPVAAWGQAEFADQPASIEMLDVIVELEPGVNPERAARGIGARPKLLYTEVFDGFAARLPRAAIEALKRNPRVAQVTIDRPVYALGQEVPTGISRIGADSDEGIAGDRGGGRTDVDVAVLDTGIATVRDLRVKGGKSCVGGERWVDDHGHGTLVAGVIGAKDNGRGVVGVAPGARLWSIKVLDAWGRGTSSTVICGLDWVLRHKKKIEVVNLSIGGTGTDGRCSEDPYHRAICKVNRAGIPVVTAAGNDGKKVDTTVPAVWKETIAVSAYADLDGKPGGTGGQSCFDFLRRGEVDDTFASFSNYGRAIDVAAPGACILSTSRFGRTDDMSGTSIAAPHVTGALALHKAKNRRSSSNEARKWLRDFATRGRDSEVGFTGDPDRFPERVLYLGGS